MTPETDPGAPAPVVRPGRIATILFGLAILIDLGAAICLAWALAATLAAYALVPEDLLISGGLLAVAVACIAGALIARRRARPVLAMVLAWVPATAALLCLGVVILFVATFTHQP